MAIKNDQNLYESFNVSTNYSLLFLESSSTNLSMSSLGVPLGGFSTNAFHPQDEKLRSLRNELPRQRFGKMHRSTRKKHSYY